MPAIHASEFARTLSGRLHALQHRLDALEAKLPIKRLSREAKKEFYSILRCFLTLRIDSGGAGREITALFDALGKKCKGFRQKRSAVHRALNRSIDPCPHDCPGTSIEHYEGKVIIDRDGPLRLCLAKALVKRFPRNFRLRSMPPPESRPPHFPKKPSKRLSLPFCQICGSRPGPIRVGLFVHLSAAQSYWICCQCLSRPIHDLLNLAPDARRAVNLARKIHEGVITAWIEEGSFGTRLVTSSPE